MKKEEREAKPDQGHKEPEPEPEPEEQSVGKERTKERSKVFGTRGPRTNKSRGSSERKGGGGEVVVKSPNPVLKPNSDPTPAENPPDPAAKAENKNGRGITVAKRPAENPLEPAAKAENKIDGGITMAKKRSAANFLNRINRTSRSPNGALLEKLKGTPGSGGRGTEQKKGGRGDGRKEQAVRPGLGAGSPNQAPEHSVPVKRSVGRPPKRAAPPPTLAPPAKRAREEAEATPPPSKKRGRR